MFGAEAVGPVARVERVLSAKVVAQAAEPLYAAQALLAAHLRVGKRVAHRPLAHPLHLGLPPPVWPRDVLEVPAVLLVGGEGPLSARHRAVAVSVAVASRPAWSQTDRLRDLSHYSSRRRSRYRRRSSELISATAVCAVLNDFDVARRSVGLSLSRAGGEAPWLVSDDYGHTVPCHGKAREVAPEVDSAEASQGRER